MTAMTWRYASLTVLVIYWLALAIATHLPRAPELPLEQGDKFLHVAAFAVLATLAATCWSAWRPPMRTGHFLMLAAILIAYAALDEVTQVPVGRKADVADWMADVVGILIGIGAFGIFCRFWART